MSAAVAGASSETCPQTDSESAGQRIIKQDKDNDIKDYAETTMNELLGWYGYDKLDTRGINLKNLGHHFPATSSSSSSPIRPDDDASEDDTGHSISPGAENESTPPNSAGGNTIICAWCLKMGLKLFTLKTASGETKEFCSEPCFNQCRRAAFKKNRVCNWCRHVRHTVNYVDFQDGDDQLQFCSDKCLNQYKMQIFCKETQAYLQMNPHLQEESSKHAASSKLITPDLWLRDCQESTNGGMSQSGDEVQAKPGDKDELEDLSVTSKSDHNSPSFNQEREIHKNVIKPVKENLTERCNTLASYLSDEKDKSDRKKRHHEMHRESSRKRQRISSFRNKSNHTPEAPPAHLSSAPSSLTFQNQSSIFPPPTASFPLPLRSKSPVHINPPAAHSKSSFNPHPSVINSVLHPGLPPPPPLLNNDFYHSPFNPSVFPSHQQQLDAVLRMQASYSPNAPFNPSFFHDSMLPFLRSTAQSNSRAMPQPNTVMLPYPIFVPLPVPIPIPLPLKCFLPKDKSSDKSPEKSTNENKPGDGKSSETIYNDLTNNSKNITDDERSSLTNGKNLSSAPSSTDSDYDEHKSHRKIRKR